LKLAFDTNVILDVLLERAPYAESASRLWAGVETGKAVGVLPAHAITTLWSLVAETRSAASARTVVALVARVFDVATVDQSVVRRALELEFRDFEDAVCAAAAEVAGCELIVTRNGRDFAGSPVRAVDPLTALALLEGGGASGVSERRGTDRSARRAPTRARRAR
jgi:predicted nucleic acid-binding protein